MPPLRARTHAAWERRGRRGALPRSAWPEQTSPGMEMKTSGLTRVMDRMPGLRGEREGDLPTVSDCVFVSGFFSVLSP